MTRKLFIASLLLFLNVANGQVLGGYVEYSLSFIDDKELSKSGIGTYFKSAKDNAKYVTFILEFNKDEMCFFAQTTKIDGINLDFSIAFSGVDGKYYRKADESTVLHYSENIMVGKSVINEDMKVDWKLHNETKKIQDFLCYKASTIIKFNNGVGDFQKELTVWYCPQIPYAYGPKGYGQLSGMILEYHYDRTVIGAKKIVFSKDAKVKVPTGGKLMTREEYSEILNKKVDDSKY
jgi:GLPGLI family protein